MVRKIGQAATQAFDIFVLSRKLWMRDTGQKSSAVLPAVSIGDLQFFVFASGFWVVLSLHKLASVYCK